MVPSLSELRGDVEGARAQLEEKQAELEQIMQTVCFNNKCLISKGGVAKMWNI